jgi:hypothetical protein
VEMPAADATSETLRGLSAGGSVVAETAGVEARGEVAEQGGGADGNAKCKLERSK